MPIADLSNIIDYYNIPEDRIQLLEETFNIAKDLGIPKSLAFHVIQKESAIFQYDNYTQLTKAAWEDVRHKFGNKYSKEDLNLLNTYLAQEDALYESYLKQGNLSRYEARRKATEDAIKAFSPEERQKVNNLTLKAGLQYLKIQYDAAGKDPIKTLAYYRKGKAAVSRLNSPLDDKDIYSYTAGLAEAQVVIDKTNPNDVKFLDPKTFQKLIGATPDGYLGEQSKAKLKEYLQKNYPSIDTDIATATILKPLGDNLYKLDTQELQKKYPAIWNGIDYDFKASFSNIDATKNNVEITQTKVDENPFITTGDLQLDNMFATEANTPTINEPKEVLQLQPQSQKQSQTQPNETTSPNDIVSQEVVPEQQTAPKVNAETEAPSLEQFKPDVSITSKKTEVLPGVPTAEEFQKKTEENIQKTLEETKPGAELTPDAVDTEAHALALNTLDRDASLAAFVEGLAFNRDLFDIDEYNDANPIAINAARIAGSFSNDILSVLLSSGIANALKGVVWIGKALNYTEKTSKIVKLGKVGINGLLEGAIFTGIKYVANSEDKKPTKEDLGYNLIQFGLGDVGREGMNMLLKNVPISDWTKELFRFSADTVTGAAGVLAVNHDLNEFQMQTLSSQALAIGAVDLLMYGISRGKLNNSRYAEAQAKKTQDSLSKYLDNPTSHNGDVLARDIDALVEITKPHGESVEEFKAKLDELDVELKQDVKKVIENKSPIPKEDSEIPKSTTANKMDIKAPDNTKVTLEFEDKLSKEVLDFAVLLKKDIFNEYQESAIARKLLDDLRLKDVDIESFKLKLKELPDVKAKEAAEVETKQTKVNLNIIYDYLKNADVITKVPKAVLPKVDKPKTQPKEVTEVNIGQKLKEILKEPTPEETKKLQTETKPPEEPINTTRLDTDPKVQKIIYDISQKVDKEIPKKTLEEIATEAQKLANETGLDIEQAKKLIAVTKDLPEYLTAYRQLVVKNGEDIVELAEKVSNGNATELEQAQFLQKLELQSSLVGDLKQLWRNVSHTMNSGRINVGGDYMWIGNILPEDLPHSPDGIQLAQATTKFNFDLQMFAKKIMENKDLITISKVSKELTKSKLYGRVLTELTSSNLLSNIGTFFRNATAQTANLIFDAIHTVAKAGVNTFIRDPEGTTWAEAGARLYGMIRGISDAFLRPLVTRSEAYAASKATIGKAIEQMSVFDLLSLRLSDPKRYEAIMSGINALSRTQSEGYKPVLTSDVLTKADPNKPLLKFLWETFDWFAANQRLLSFGMLETGDRPFVQAYYESSVLGNIIKYAPKADTATKKQLLDRTMKYRKAMQLIPKIEESIGLKINKTDPNNPVRQKLKEIIGEDIFDYDNLKFIKELDKQALEEAARGTWKNEIDSKILKDFERFINKHPSLRVFFPFIHTPTKIFEKWSYSSGLSSKFWKDILGKNGAKAKENAWAALATSTLLYGMAGILYSNKLLIPGARNRDEQQAMLEAGIQPNSIRIGDTYINFNTLDPAPAMFFSTMAELARAWEEYQADQDPDKTEYEKLLEHTGDVLGAISQNVLSKTWLTSVRQFINAINGYDTDYYLKQFSAKFVPGTGIKKSIETYSFWGLNPFYKDYLDGVKDDLGNQLPRLDRFGKPIVKYKQPIGINVSKETDSPIRIELLKLNLNLASLGKVVKGVQLTDGEWYDMMRYLANNVRAEEKLNKLIKSKAYQTAPDNLKKDMIKNYWNKLKAIARNYILSKPKVRQRYTENVKSKYSEELNVPSWLLPSVESSATALKNAMNK